jgi:hypothetical protein
VQCDAHLGGPAGGSHPDGCSPHQWLDMACRDVRKRSYVLQSNTLHWVGESRGQKVKIIFREKFHIMVNISKDSPAASISFRQVQEKMTTEVLPKRGCWEKSEEKVIRASRFGIDSFFGGVSQKLIDFGSCGVRIRASEAVRSSAHQISNCSSRN